MWLVRVCIWLSLVDPKLESGMTTREAVSYYPSPGSLGLRVTDVPVQLPGLSLEIVAGLPGLLVADKGALWVVGQSSFLTCGHCAFVFSVSPVDKDQS